MRELFEKVDLSASSGTRNADLISQILMFIGVSWIYIGYCFVGRIT